MRPIPPGRRDGRKFKNAVVMLAWTLDRFHYRRRSGLTLSIADVTAADRFIAMATLTRVAASHAQAILAMSRKSVAESSYVNLRAMLEIWADFRLLRNDTSERTFRSMYLAAALALLRKSPDATMEAQLQKRFGVAFHAAQSQMNKKPFAHWSGRSRKGVIEAECGAIYGQMYEFLSWDSHPVIQVALDMQEVDRVKGKYQLGHRIPQAEVATIHCTQATHILRDMWNELTRHQPL